MTMITILKRDRHHRHGSSNMSFFQVWSICLQTTDAVVKSTTRAMLDLQPDRCTKIREKYGK